MDNEGTMAIGPWGWIGWFVAACVSMLLIKVWHSASAVSLRQMQREIQAARTLVSQQKSVIHKQSKQINSLRLANRTLEKLYEETKAQGEMLKEANDRMRVGLADLAKALKKEEELRDAQFKELIATKGRHGEL